MSYDPVNSRQSVCCALGGTPAAALRSVPVTAVKLGDGFFLPRLETNRRVNIPTLLQRMEEHGFLDNFRRAAERKECERKERHATDADVFKWIEAASFALAGESDIDLQRRLNQVIDDVVAAQSEEGYLNTWYVFEKSEQRFSELSQSHELFNAGHLIQAGLAHLRVTGDSRLFDAAERYADYLCDYFLDREVEGGSGHPGLEVALVELYRVMGEEKYLRLCRKLLDWKGLNDYAGMEKHCVETLYLCCGAADYCAETGDETLRVTQERLWQDMVRHKLHVTGGVGSREFREDFGFPFQLPTVYAYCETCASIANIMWNFRLLHMEGGAQYADLLERVLYNTLLAGVSLAGGEYFYTNPLGSLEGQQRQPWQTTPCCLPNIQRLLASLPGYLYSTSDEGVWVHLYDTSTLDWQLPDGRMVLLKQKTQYPWNGRISLNLYVDGEAPCSLFLRIPGWCRQASVSINGAPEPHVPRPGTYMELHRTWKGGDRVDLQLDLQPQLWGADPRVRSVAHCAAVQRGPLVYCAEACDNPHVPLLSTRLCLTGDDGGPVLTDSFQPKLLGGIAVVQARAAFRPDVAPDDALYAPLPDYLPAPEETTLRMVPYAVWANRDEGPMAVWLPTC